MSLNWDKYDIEVREYDAIKRNQIFFDSMQQTVIYMDGLYMDGEYLLIDIINKYQLRNQISAEVERLNRDKKNRKKVTYNSSTKKAICE